MLIQQYFSFGFVPPDMAEMSYVVCFFVFFLSYPKSGDVVCA